MKSIAWLAGACVAAWIGTAQAQTSYISCAVQTIFRKPYTHGTDWVHVENRYTKFFKLDASARMIAFWDNRKLIWKPICAASNRSCAVNWSANGISIDGTKTPNDPVPPYLDFRRSIVLSPGNAHVTMVQGDWGQSTTGQPNMTWTYEGDCTPSGPPSMQPFGRRAMNPLYQKASAPAVPVSKEEAARVMAGYVGNTMTGYSGGGHWFHMWIFTGYPLVAYTSDDEDISGEGNVRTWWVGKDSTGYRMCPTVDIARDVGAPKMVPGINCYPLLIKKVGDSWVEHDMDGDAYFTMLPGRQ